MLLNKADLKEFLDEKSDKYNNSNFIELEPISIPHSYSKKEDIEISGFLAATICRKMIVRNTTSFTNSKTHFRSVERVSGKKKSICSYG